MSSKYKTCPKCKVKHSAVVPHKCFKVKKDKPPELETVDHDFEKEGETISTDDNSVPTEKPEKGGEANDGEADGESNDDGDADGEGESEGDADGDSEGDGEGKAKAKGEGEGDGEGEDEDEAEGETEAEAEGPQPQAPEPETPPVQVVCTVLKFAALCAQCAKNGSIEITLTEDGLFVYGHNGDMTAYDTLPWGEFEKRSTLDGEFYVKEVIDGVDAKLNESDDKARLQALIQQAKDGKLDTPKEEAKVEKEAGQPKRGKRKAA
jgi:hypothetical protein